MKILVTGGAGFIGSHLIDRLIDKGEDVVCVDNLLLGKKEHLNGVMQNKHFQLHEFDLLDLDKLDLLFATEKFDVVYHLAANSDIQLGHSKTMTDLNNTFLTTFNILSCMKTHKVQKIVFASSSAIYGETNEAVSEDTGPLLPISNYGAAKLASEAYISSFCENYGMKSWMIRFPNVIGWRLTHGVIYDFLNKLEKNPSELLVLGDGMQQKPYLYVDDLLDAIECIFNSSDNKVNIYNVAAASVTTVKEIADMVLRGMELKDTKISFTGETRGWIGDVPKFSYDIAKVISLNWSPAMTSNQAVMLSIKTELEYRKENL